MSGNSEEFVSKLVDAVPALRADLDRYWQDYLDYRAEGIFDPPDPQGFLLRLAIDAVHHYAAGEPAAEAQLRDLLGFLESEHGRDPEIDALIDDWFVAYLPDPREPYSRVLALLGPALRATRERQLREDADLVPPSTAAFVHRLAAAVPGVRDELAEHLRDRHGELLPHPFLSQIAVRAADLYDAGSNEPVQMLLEFLESEFGRDAEVDELIAVSFVEMMPYPDERGAGLTTRLGPKLAAELSQQRS